MVGDRNCIVAVCSSLVYSSGKKYQNKQHYVKGFGGKTMKQASSSAVLTGDKLNHESTFSYLKKLLTKGAMDWNISINVLVIILVIPFAIALAGAASALLGKEAYKWFTQEDGFAEIMQVLFYSLALIISIVITRREWREKNKIVAILYTGLCFGLFFLIGEELNWGQRIFGWQTAESFAAINKQDETNLHNIYGVGAAFKWVQLLVGAYGTLFPLALLKWKPAVRVQSYAEKLIPNYTLIPYFFMLFVWRIFRNLFEVPDRFYFVVAEYNEVMEMILAIGFFLFVVYQWRKLRSQEV